jgi:hypothetical protein
VDKAQIQLWHRPTNHENIWAAIYHIRCSNGIQIFFKCTLSLLCIPLGPWCSFVVDDRHQLFQN